MLNSKSHKSKRHILSPFCHFSTSSSKRKIDLNHSTPIFNAFWFHYMIKNGSKLYGLTKLKKVSTPGGLRNSI